MTDPVGVALIGTGFWGQRMAQAIQRTPDIRLITCYSRGTEKREAFAAEFGCAAADTLEVAISHSDVEGVLLITPNHAHLEGVAACTARGKAVFLEKPIADTLEDGQRITAACEEAGIPLMVGHAFRRLGAARKVKDLLDQGALGLVVLAEANFSLPGKLSADKWRYYRETCPGGPLMQLGVHHADTLQYWLGPVTQVFGSFARLATPAEIDDLGVASLVFASGARGTLTGSYVSPKTYWLRLYGTDANLDYETDMSIWPDAPRMDPMTTLVLTDKAGTRTPVAFEPRDMLADELTEFAHCVRGTATPETGAVEALRALSVIRGALASHERGQPVTLETF